MRAILLCGAPGAGKSYLAKQLSQDTGIRLIDDCFPEDIDYINNFLAPRGLDFILTDPHLCLPESRIAAIKRLSDLGYEMEFVFFENDYEACLGNIQRRIDIGDIRNVKSFLKWICDNYEVPNNSTVLPVWKGDS